MDKNLPEKISGAFVTDAFWKLLKKILFLLNHFVFFYMFYDK